MGKLTLAKIAEELNEAAVTHPIGALQEIRGHRPNAPIFRINTKAFNKRWTFHWGGRKELQYNIGLWG